MQIQLKKPELERYIDGPVKAGHFPTPDAAVEAAVEQVMRDEAWELDDETVSAINRAEAQIDRGEGIDFKQFSTEMRKKLAAG